MEIDGHDQGGHLDDDELALALVRPTKKHRLISGVTSSAFASPSSSSCPLPGEVNDLARPTSYDVFISFRGSDVRDTFLAHLYRDLNDLRKLTVYKDDVDLQRGLDISPQLLRAIEISEVYIVILSPRYTDSAWCLEELEQILKCRQRYGRTVIPVFYNVNPSDVKNQKQPSSVTATAETIESWSATLRKIANLSGFHSKVIRPETKLLAEIAKAVFQAMPSKSRDVSSYLDGKGLVGLGWQIEQIKGLMCLDKEVNRTIGLWGMAGIGKTRTARAVFDLFSYRFEASHFFSNFAERATLLGHDLENDFFSKLLGDDGSAGASYHSIRGRLGRKKVLVVIDDVGNDVGNILALKDLLDGKYCDLFGPGSIIILTSRNQQLLKSVCHHVYEVMGLDYDEAFRLFCSHAFKWEKRPPSEFTEMTVRAVTYVDGNPLAITVLAAHLFGKGLDFWRRELDALKHSSNQTVEKVLRRSYDGLSPAEKDGFLDLACFYTYWREMDSWRIRQILSEDKKGDIMTNLIDKSLISTNINIDNSLQMHALLKDLGRRIVGMTTRFWIAEDVWRRFKENKWTKSTEGIFLYEDDDQERDVLVQPDSFMKMKRLRFLVIRSKTCELITPNDELKCLPNALRILEWHHFPFKCLPSQFSAENLVILDLGFCDIEQIWECESNVDLGNLKFLSIRGFSNLIKLPNLSTAKRLKEVCLSGCHSLVELPTSILDLPKLEYLDLSDCSNLKWDNLEDYANRSREQSSRPPDVFPNLEILVLTYTTIQKVPSFITRLEILELECCKCTELTEFPVIPSLEGLTVTHSLITEVLELERLTELKSLKLPRNNQLALISCDFSKMDSLEKFQLDGCSKLSRLPDSIGLLTHLQSLDLSRTAVRELPSSVKDLTRLCELILKCCKSLARLPDTIHKLSKLDTLELAGCDQLRHLPELPSPLRNLDADGCKSLQTLSLGIVEKHDFTDAQWCFAHCWKLDPVACSKLVDKFVMDSVQSFGRSSLLLPAKWGSESGDEGSTMRCNNSNSYSMVTVKLRGQPWKSKSTIFGALLNTPDPLLYKDFKFLVECVMLNKEDNVGAEIVVGDCNWKPFGEYEDQEECLSNRSHLLVWSTRRPLVAGENADDGSTLEFLFRVKYKYGFDGSEITNLIRHCRVIPVYDDRVVMNEDSEEDEGDDPSPNDLQGLYDQMCAHL